MFCARCGQQIPDTTVICPLCGRESTIQLQPLPELQAAAPALGRIRAGEIAIDGPQGVRGWLLFFCVVITVLSPIAAFIQLASLGTFRSGLSRVYILEVLRIAYGLIVGIFLWFRRTPALTLLRVFFVFVGINALLSLLSLVPQGMRSGWGSVLLAERFTQVLTQIGYNLLWYAYFHKSRRVKNTYGANL